MKKHLFLLFTLLLSVTMFAQEARTAKNSSLLLKATPVLQGNNESGGLQTCVLNNPTSPGRAQGDVVFSENFTATTWPPTGWTRIHTGTNQAQQWVRSTTNAYDGGHAYHQDFNYGAERSSYLITPAITIPAGQEYILEYMSRIDDYGGYYYYSGVHISTTVNDNIAAFTEIAENDTYTNQQWGKKSIRLGAYHGQTVYIAFVYTAVYSHDWRVDNVEVIDNGPLPQNDLSVSGVYPFTQVPAPQILLPTLTAKVLNEGMAAQTNVVVTVKLNETVVGTSTPLASLAPGASANITINIPGSVSIPQGDNALSFVVSQTQTDENPANNTMTTTLTGTAHKFAVDDNRSQWNIGNTTPISLGNIFTITQQTTLNAVELRFSASTPTAFSISLYPMNGNVPGTVIFTHPATKPTTAGFITVMVPATVLEPGNYFLCADQTANTNFTLNADGNPNRLGYALIGSAFMDINTGYGAVIGAPFVRMLVNLPANDIQIVARNPLLPYSKLPVTQVPGAYAALMPFPTTLTAQAFNAGTAAQTNVVFSATLNGTSLGSSAPVASLASGATTPAMNITPPEGTTYPATPGTHNLVYTVTQTQPDAYPADNTTTFPLEIASTYALEDLTTFSSGVGSNGGTISAGNIFNIYAPTLLKQILVAFNGSGQPYTVTLYRMTTTTAINATALLTIPNLTTALGITTLNVPGAGILLEPGDYYLCANQTGTINFGITYDDRPAARRLYTKTLTGTALTAQAGFGAGLIRMVVMDELTCTATMPTNLTVTNITAKSAVFSWDGDAELYTLTVSTGSTNLVYNTTGNTYTVTGLPYGTAFTWSVKAICYATNNPTANGPAFSTLSCVRTLPLAEDFSATLDECWENIRTAGTATPGTFSFTATALTGNPTGVTPQSGTHMAAFNSAAYATGTTASLITYPISDIKEGTIFKFWMYRNSGGNADLIRIYASNTTTTPAVANALLTVNRANASAPAVPANGWYEYWAEAPAGDFQHFIVQAVSARATTGAANQNNMYIDNVNIYDPHWITTIAGVGGTIDPTYPAIPGTNKTINFAANTGYLIETVLVNGVSTPSAIHPGAATGSYTFENISGPQTIEVIFVKTWVITVTNTTPTLGTVDPSETITYKHYETPTYTFTPQPFHHVEAVKVNGVTVLEGNPSLTETLTYTFTGGLTENVTLTVEFAINRFTLSLVATPGTVTPTSITVYANTPIGPIPVPVRPGYDYQWFIGTTLITENTVWTYTSNQTATATWSALSYTLTLNPSTGAVYPTSKTVTFDQPVGTLPIPTQTDCIFVGWFIGNTEITETTIWNYTSNQTAIAVFDYPVFVTVTNSDWGTVNPAGAVNYYSLNDNQTYIFTPIDNAHITRVTIDGKVEFAGQLEVTAPFDFTFTNIDKAHYVEVVFALNCYVPIIIKDVGVVSVTPATCVTQGAEVTFTITPDYCYDITEVLINGEPMGTGTTHTIIIDGKPTIEVTTLIRPYTITATPAEGVDPMGYIFPDGETIVNCGDDMEYEFHPEIGYRVSGVFVDNVRLPLPTTIRQYTVTNIRSNKTIHVEFEEFPYYIFQFGPHKTEQAENGGWVHPEFALDATMYFVPVDSGSDRRFFIQAIDGFEIDQLFIDNKVSPFTTQTSNQSGTYVFSNVDDHHSIFATFKPIQWTITATSDPNGYIMPSGAVKVDEGDNQTFQVTPKTGYEVSAIRVDGSFHQQATADGMYEFVNVRANHTISVEFAKVKYTITTLPGENGTITPSNPKVEHGGNQTVTITPATGYKIGQVFIDGVPTPSAAQAGFYTFTNVIKEYTIEAIFIKQTFTITATATPGGFLAPTGTATVEFGAHSSTYVFFADPGYHIKSVLVNGIPNAMAVQEGMYRFLSVSANQTLHVVFSPDNFTINATTTAGGFISPAGSVSVPAFTDKTFTFKADAGFELIRVTVNNISIGNPDSYTFENVSADQAIAAQFDRIQYTVTLPEIEGATVTPASGFTTTVAHGDKFMFVVTLKEGYTQSNITVRTNSIILTPFTGVYTINNIVADQLITIDGVALNMYRILARAHAGGTISPAGTFMVEHGQDKTFDMIPNTGFEVKEVYVNGAVVALEEDLTYTYTVTADGTIEVYFQPAVRIGENDKVISVFSHSNVVTIVNEGLIPVKQVEIMDMYGRVVWKGQANDERTEITLHVATGIYNVRVITESTILTTKVSIK